MLKGLDPLLNADLLYVLAAMGHGDELALVDKNFPAVSLGARVIRLEGVDAPRVLEAILSVMPLDDMLDTPYTRMVDLGFAEVEELEICRGSPGSSSGTRDRAGRSAKSTASASMTGRGQPSRSS